MNEERPEWFKALVNRLWNDYQHLSGAPYPTDEITIGNVTVKRKIEDLYKIIVSIGFETEGEDNQKEFLPWNFYNLDIDGNIQIRMQLSTMTSSLLKTIALSKSSTFLIVD